jgi:hypothetical protein
MLRRALLGQGHCRVVDRRVPENRGGPQAPTSGGRLRTAVSAHFVSLGVFSARSGQKSRRNHGFAPKAGQKLVVS